MPCHNPHFSNDSQSQLFYPEEHLSCLNYRMAVDSGFKVVELSVGAVLRSQLMPRHNLIMLLSGSITITCDNYPVRVLGAREMILVPRSSNFLASVEQQTTVVIFGFELPESPCDKLRLESYLSVCEQIEYDFQPVAIKRSLELFLDLLMHYINSGVNCVHLQESKHKELFLCLYAFYSKEEVALLLHPIIPRKVNFHDTILGNSDSFICVNDMVDLSNMSRTQFYIRFKEEFGITAKQWLLKHRIQKIRIAASMPNVTAKQLMIDLSFESPSQLSQFCRLHFGLTPSQLIQSLKKL